MKKEVKLPLDSLSDFAVHLTKWTQSEVSTEIEQVASQHLLSNLINKRVEELSDYTNYILSEWNQSTSNQSRSNGIFIDIVLWIAKGLVCRGDNLGIEIVTKTLDLIASDSPYANKVASLVGEIANDENGDVLDKKKSFAVTRVLFKQKFFEVVFPEVVSRYESENSSKNGAYFSYSRFQILIT